MGLDMYLYAEKYISRNDYNAFDRNTMEFPPINPMFEAVLDATNSRTLVEPDGWTGIKVDIPVGYWRKANAIHSYIVENHADGVDECQRIVLGAPDLTALRNICNEVFVHYTSTGSTVMAEELLPTRSGFFFGGTEYDEWYYQDIQNTIAVIDRALDEPDCDHFIYQASW